MDANLLLETATDHRKMLQETRAYEYDSIGNLKKAVAGGFLYQYRYRPDGKLLEKTSSGKSILSCTNHGDGSLKTLTDATGKTACYGYDYWGKLERITDETGLEIVHYTHYADGNLKEIRHFNGIKTLYEYDTDENITRLATLFSNGSALCDLRYAYDLNGNRTAKAGSRLMAGEENLLAANIRYRYDSMNRLQEEDNQGETERYQYDLCGSRLFHKTIDGEERYQYNNRNQLTHLSGADGSISYTYNAQGNITAETSLKGTTTYGYNLFNRQSKVEMADGQMLESIYDGEGLRAGTVQNGKASTFFYFNGELLGEEQSNRMILGYGVAASEVRGKAGYHAYHSDEQLSTGYVTNAEQGVENRYTYNAFGEVREKEEHIHNRILYTGQQYDQVTGQYYLRARFYNPVVGRFLQEDEYRGDGLNLYAYCGNNPVVYYDPSGFAQKYTVDEIVAALNTDSNGNKYIFNKEHGTAYKTNTLSPDNYNGFMHSHHGLQKAWANQNLKAYGYDEDLAPTITLETNGGGAKNTPHSNISGQQTSYNRQNGSASGNLEDRIIMGTQQQLNAGISKDVVMKDLDNNYKMIDKLNRNNTDKIEAGKLAELTYSRKNIKDSLVDAKQNEQKNDTDKCQ